MREAMLLPEALREPALTEGAVAAWMTHVFHGRGRVERFDLPGIGALNFLLHDALAGGGTASLRHDPQGKALAQRRQGLKRRAGPRGSRPRRHKAQTERRGRSPASLCRSICRSISQ